MIYIYFNEIICHKNLKKQKIYQKKEKFAKTSLIIFTKSV